ncbi:MAG: hypothetical protein U1E66_04850 [Rhodospirillales bacterium]
MSEEKTTAAENEGEGSRSAARAYNKHTEEFVATGQVNEAAKEAEAALEGPEGDKLRAAEAKGRAKEGEGTKAERER